jgi:hypothetical protein
MARVSREGTTRDPNREQTRLCEGSWVGGEANGRSFTCGGVPMNLALAANEIRASIDAIVGLVNMCAFIRASFEGSAAKALIEATITAALPDSELAAAAKTAASAAFLLFHFCADASTSTRISSRCVAITAAIASIWSCPTVSRENPAAAVSTANLPRLRTYMSTAPGTAFLHLYTRPQYAIDVSRMFRARKRTVRAHDHRYHVWQEREDGDKEKEGGPKKKKKRDRHGMTLDANLVPQIGWQLTLASSLPP